MYAVAKDPADGAVVPGTRSVLRMLDTIAAEPPRNVSRKVVKIPAASPAASGGTDEIAAFGREMKTIDDPIRTIAVVTMRNQSRSC